MNKKLSFVLPLIMILVLLSSSVSVAFASGEPPVLPAVDAKAYAYADVGQIQILSSGLNEINHDKTVIFLVPFNSYAGSGAYAQSGKGWLTGAEAGAYAYADGQAWGSVTKPDGSLAYWFETGIMAKQDYGFDAELNVFKPSSADASAYAEYTQYLVITTVISLDQIGDWEAYLGADTLAKAFAEAGYIMCKGLKCSGDADFAEACDYDWAELWKVFHVYDAPQLPSLKVVLHTDELSDIQIYRGNNLIDPWTVASLSQKPVEMVVPYDVTLAGLGAWFDIQRGAYMIQIWDPVLGHAHDLFGIVVYQTKATGQEIHLWPYPNPGDAVVQNRGTLIFATRPAAEAIQAAYETLGRNPTEEELVSVVTGAVGMSLEQLEAYLAVVVS